MTPPPDPEPQEGSNLQESLNKEVFEGVTLGQIFVVTFAILLTVYLLRKSWVWVNERIVRAQREKAVTQRNKITYDLDCQLSNQLKD